MNFALKVLIVPLKYMNECVDNFSFLYDKKILKEMKEENLKTVNESTRCLI
jgi:hypothetical protein